MEDVPEPSAEHLKEILSNLPTSFLMEEQCRVTQNLARLTAKNEIIGEILLERIADESSSSRQLRT